MANEKYYAHKPPTIFLVTDEGTWCEFILTERYWEYREGLIVPSYYHSNSFHQIIRVYDKTGKRTGLFQIDNVCGSLWNNAVLSQNQQYVFFTRGRIENEVFSSTLYALDLKNNLLLQDQLYREKLKNPQKIVWEGIEMGIDYTSDQYNYREYVLGDCLRNYKGYLNASIAGKMKALMNKTITFRKSPEKLALKICPGGSERSLYATKSGNDYLISSSSDHLRVVDLSTCQTTVNLRLPIDDPYYIKFIRWQEEEKKCYLMATHGVNRHFVYVVKCEEFLDTKNVSLLEKYTIKIPGSVGDTGNFFVVQDYFIIQKVSSYYIFNMAERISNEK